MGKAPMFDHVQEHQLNLETDFFNVFNVRGLNQPNASGIS